MATKANDRRGPRAFASKPEVLAMLPDVKGNHMNGLGEEAERRPTPIMWHEPDILPHGDLQEWFINSASSPGALKWHKINREYTGRELSPLGPRRPDWSAGEWTAKVKEASLAREADLVAIAQLDQGWVFKGYEAPNKWMVVIAVAMDYQCYANAPSDESHTQTHAQYSRCTRAAYKLADWMREHGWDAKPHGGPNAGPILIIPAAIAAGLGELGKHGSMINRELGSTFRLACVMTDMPLVPDSPDMFGADDFCTNCQICTKACPTGAIHAEKQTVRGRSKWHVDFDECIRYFIENYGCGICIARCPWSRPGVAPRLAERMTRRKARGPATV
ncbi:MAG TPA: 4Fe-4S dicluster domain-containing protein [Rhodospirillales bacterium]|jgi:ferredoxin|nr:4Fe-4S dicluster domain-containing protein [Rhodospirillales bacterium]